MNKKLIFILGILLLGVVSAQGTYCCEKTTYGPWCQNEIDSDKCDDSYRVAEGTHCDSTSYCRVGCCANRNDGTCTPNTAQTTCDDKNGLWSSEADCDIPECQKGCCILGNQVSFVTQVKCQKYASLYGIGISFRTDINSEFECSMTSISQEKGACVFERDFQLTCSISTRKDCTSLEATGTNTDFYKGKLCTYSNLNTNCAPTSKTTCVTGKDQVYYVDSCGNVGNVYDADKRDEESYWKNIIDISDSCDFGEGNANDEVCGNCDYLLGGSCYEYRKGIDTEPRYGDNICRDLSCKFDNDGDGTDEDYEHGESWCYNSPIHGSNLPGSVNYKVSCYNGHATIESCEPYRNDICLEDDSGVISYASCVVNRWQDCKFQYNQTSCEDEDKRECTWLVGSDYTDISEFGIAEDLCVPLYTPGHEFWNDAGDCASGTSKCVVIYEDGWFDKATDIASNKVCLDPPWKVQKNNFCVATGDCGISVNYLNISGAYIDLNHFWSAGAKKTKADEIQEELNA